MDLGTAELTLKGRWAYLEKGVERVMTQLEGGIDMLTVSVYYPLWRAVE